MRTRSQEAHYHLGSETPPSATCTLYLTTTCRSHIRRRTQGKVNKKYLIYVNLVECIFMVVCFRWQGNRRLQFLPYPDQGKGKMVVAPSTQMLNVMMGTAYLEHSAHSETESPCPSPETDREDMELSSSTKRLQYVKGKGQKRLLSLRAAREEKERVKRKARNEVSCWLFSFLMEVNVPFVLGG